MPAQTATVTDTECERLRERLAEHARVSDGVRRALGIQMTAAPAAPAAGVATASKSETIRARLEQIPKERQSLDEQRLGAMVEFDLSRAAEIQGKIQALDAEAFQAGGTGTPVAYAKTTCRIDEMTARKTGQSLGDLLAVRPAGPVRVTTQTADFGKALAQFQAASFADTAKVGTAAARNIEFQNLRGQNVRMLEIIAAVPAGVSLRRTAVVAQPNDQELWEETTTVVKSPSYGDVEVVRSRETRTTSGAVVGTPSISGPTSFTLER